MSRLDSYVLNYPAIHLRDNQIKYFTKVAFWAGYYKASEFLKSMNYQFSVKYGGKVHCSKSSLIWYFRPCPLSARSGGSVSHTTQQSFLQWDLYFRNHHQKWSWFMGIRPLKSKENFRTHFWLFHFFCNHPPSLTEISAQDHPLPGLNHSKWPGESEFYDERNLNIRRGPLYTIFM